MLILAVVLGFLIEDQDVDDNDFRRSLPPWPMDAAHEVHWIQTLEIGE